jgi:hypothetical protein
MSKTKSVITLLGYSLLVISNQLYADDSEYEQHEAHVHGEAEMLIALEGSTLEIEFHSPAMNIVGFEHQPKTEQQTDAIEKAIDTLKQPGKLFALATAAECKPVAIDVATPLAKHGHDEHSHQEHDAHHEHEKEHEHEHEHEVETHSDFTAHYQFQCADLNKLDKIEFDLFKHFPGTERLEVLSISNKGQQMMELTPANTTLEL